LDGSSNRKGWNLAPGYAFDVGAGEFVGFTFAVQTYPGLKEWINRDFEGLRAKLYTIHPEWKAQDLLAGGVASLNKIAPGLAAKFLSAEDNIEDIEALAMPFRFDTLATATPLTRPEFIAEQRSHALGLRDAILADSTAATALAALAADAEGWVQGWLAALETAGLLRPVDQVPPVREGSKVINLNATLASGILIGKAGDLYRTQADLVEFFAKVQEWYGDTARYGGDPKAAKAPVDYLEIRETDDGDIVEIPVPVAPNPADYQRNARQDTHFISFDLFVGGQSELEYLRHIGLLDAEFRPVGPQALNLAQYLQQNGSTSSSDSATIAVQGPQKLPSADGSLFMPVGYALPYTVSFSNPGTAAVGQIRLISQLDADLDPRSLRLGALQIGEISLQVPADQAVFQGDFDYTGSLGFVLRVSAGVDAEARIATWLIQAIDPETGEVLQDPSRGLLRPGANADAVQGFVSYSIAASDQDSSAADPGVWKP
jgi:hypothetical protein